MTHSIAARTSMLALAAAVTALLGGCGGSETKTVSVAGSPTTPQKTSTTGPHTSASTSTPAVTTTTSTVPPVTTNPGATRTATAPAFTEHEHGESTTSTEGLAAAQAVVHAQGYAVKDTSDYHANQTLRVLIGTNAGSGDGYDQKAFFFVDGRYIGTDSQQPSAQISVASQSDTEVTLAYALYKPGNPLCCPAGGQATVRYQLNNGQLQPLGEIPPVNSTSGLSRQ